MRVNKAHENKTKQQSAMQCVVYIWCMLFSFIMIAPCVFEILLFFLREELITPSSLCIFNCDCIYYSLKNDNKAIHFPISL